MGCSTKKLGLKCKTCGCDLYDDNKSGYCWKHWNQYETKLAPAETKQPEPETIETLLETKPVVFETTMPAGSLGQAKLAIERAFQDAERFESIRDLLLEMKSVITRIEQVMG